MIAAAASAFREHGFHRASTEVITATAGYTRGALYANFPSKEHLFLAVLDQEIEARGELLSDPGPAGELARRYCELLDTDPGWTLALLEFSIHAARNPDLAAEMRNRTEQLRTRIADIIQTLNPSATRDSANTGARLVLCANTGVSLERALDSSAGGTTELTRAYNAALLPE